MATEEPLPFWFHRTAPASIQEIEATERHIGHQLPEEYRALLRLQNGGVSNYSGFRDGERYFPLPPLFGVGAGAQDTLARAFDIGAMEGRPEGVVLFAAAEHIWLGLDYRVARGPAVVFGNTDEDELKLVAPSFADFIRGLVEEM